MVSEWIVFLAGVGGAWLALWGIHRWATWLHDRRWRRDYGRRLAQYEVRRP